MFRINDKIFLFTSHDIITFPLTGKGINYIFINLQ